MPNNRKKIFLLVSQGFEARYLLHSDLRYHLINSGYDIVILSPSAEEEDFVNNYSNNHMTVELLNIKACNNFYSKNKFAKLCSRLRNYVLAGGGSLFAPLDDKMQSGQAKGKPEGKHKRVIFDLLVNLLRNSKSARKVLLLMEGKLVQPSIHTELFEKHNPVALIISGIGFRPTDTCVAREAKRYGSKVISVIYGWDKACSQGYKGVEPDGVVVWGESMKNEVCLFQEIDQHIVLAAGNLYFDTYKKLLHNNLRNEFFNKHGLDPNKKVILFATKSPNSYPNYLVMQLLGELIGRDYQNEFQLLIRLHPIHLNPEYSETEFGQYIKRKYSEIVEKYPCATIYLPNRFSEKTRMFMDVDEQKSISQQICFSDIIITPFSTIMLESYYFNKPVININFDLEDSESPVKFRSIAVDATQVHLKRLLESNSSLVANSVEDLLSHVRALVDNPEAKFREMGKTLEAECGPLDGQVASRATTFIKEIINA